MGRPPKTPLENFVADDQEIIIPEKKSIFSRFKKDPSQPKEWPELTPEKELEIRADERQKFAASFNLESLFVGEEAGGLAGFMPYITVGVCIITLFVVLLK